MEIVLQQFNIEEAIDSNWQASQTRIETIQREREEAEKTAISVLTQQFQRELDTYLESRIQTALDIKIVTPKIISVLGVFAVFNYLDAEFMLKRDAQQWEISFSGKTINMSPETLQKTLLFELGKFKNERLH